MVRHLACRAMMMCYFSYIYLQARATSDDNLFTARYHALTIWFVMQQRDSAAACLLVAKIIIEPG
jgi:hypothetical protein